MSWRGFWLFAGRAENGQQSLCDQMGKQLPVPGTAVYMPDII